MQLLATYRPDDAILSEEGKDDKVRLTSDRVWIIDPLGDAQEYSEPPRDDWAIHRPLGERRPRCWSGCPTGVVDDLQYRRPASRAVAHQRPARIAVSRTRPPAFVEELAAEVDAELGADELGQRQGHLRRPRRHRRVRPRGWTVRVGLRRAGCGRARAAGLHTSRADGAPLAYTKTTCCSPTCWSADRNSPTPSLVRPQPLGQEGPVRPTAHESSTTGSGARLGSRRLVVVHTPSDAGSGVVVVCPPACRRRMRCVTVRTDADHRC